MSKTIYCALCEQKIESKTDLLTSIYSFLFGIKPFHNECFAKAMKGKEVFLMGRIPINGVGFSVLCVVAIIAMIWFLIESFYVLAAIMLLPLALRLASFMIYEKKVQ